MPSKNPLGALVSWTKSRTTQRVKQTNSSGSTSVQGPSTSQPAFANTGSSERFIITHIRANDIVIDQDQRFSVGFYVAVQVGEWDDEISLPFELSSNIHLSLRTSYELSPILGNGVTSKTFVVGIDKLFQHGEKVDTIDFSPSEGEPEFPCSRFTATVVRPGHAPHAPTNVSNQQCPASDAELCSTLARMTDDGHECLSRYHRRKKLEDLKRSIAYFEQAVHTCPSAHPCRAVALFNLGRAQFISCRHDTTSPDFDIPITLYRDALHLRPVGHPDRPATLFHLARAILSQFHKSGNESRAEEARILLAQLQSICSEDSYLYQLSEGMLRECASNEDRNGSVSRSIRRAENDGLDLPEYHAPDPAILNAHAFVFMGRFYQHKHLDDIDKAIITIKKAIDLTKESDLEWALRAISHGIFIYLRSLRSNSAEDLEKAICVLDIALQHVATDHPDRPIGLISLEECLFARFQRLGRDADKDRLSSVLEEALGLITSDHPNRTALLTYVGIAYYRFYKLLRDTSHLERSISLMEEGGKSTSGEDADSYSILEQRANLDSGVFTREDTLKVFLNDLFLEYTRLCDLGWALHSRFDLFGNCADLDRSVIVKEQLVRFTQRARNPQYPLNTSLMGLSSALLVPNDRFGDMTDLHRSNSLSAEAMQLTPDDYPMRSVMLAVSGASTLQRHDRTGQIVDVDRSISVEEEAMQHVLDDNLFKPYFLSILATPFLSRFLCLHDPADLDKATFMAEEAVRLARADHPGREGFLTLLSSMYMVRFCHFDDLADLHKSVGTLEEATECVSGGVFQRVRLLALLASTLMMRSHYLGNAEDLDKSILMGEKAASLSPIRNPMLPRILSVLFGAFLLRFSQKGRATDLDKAVSFSHRALDLTPEGHATRQTLLMGIGTLSWLRFLLRGSTPALRTAISHFASAARFPTVAQALEQFSAFKAWFQCAISLRNISPSEGNQELLAAFECAIGLFPQLAWLGLPFKDRCTQLREAAAIIRPAVSLAISLGYRTRSVEWLEQGRCVLWGQSFQPRAPLDQLRDVSPDLADQFDRLSHELRQSTAVRDNFPTFFGGGEDQGESLEHQARKHRELVAERENLCKLIETIPGFEGCFSPRTYSQLRLSAHLGPVIVLHARVDCGDALIIAAHLNEPVHVLLPDINEQLVEHLRTSIQQVLSGDGRVASRDSPHRAARVAGRARLGFNYILSELWTKVVKPILHALAFSTPGEQTRVFWCPTGSISFLPIHAAGNYDLPGPGNKVSDFVISSYVPTLSIFSPSSPEPTTISNNIRLLTVPQPHSDGQLRLSGAPVEIKYIRETVARHSSSHVELHESNGNVEDVLDAMERSDWVHFACHGVQDAGSPTDSGLCLADGRRLRLSDIIRLSRPRGGLAFLSACQTATGAVELEEEVVHLSAGMLFAGYSSVIGTMWSIIDSVAPQLAKDVYEQLFRTDGGVPDSREAARALHDAVERLRRNGAPFIAWVPFIHMGV